jgi:hypothetical protein
MEMARPQIVNFLDAREFFHAYTKLTLSGAFFPWPPPWHCTFYFWTPGMATAMDIDMDTDMVMPILEVYSCFIALDFI